MDVTDVLTLDEENHHLGNVRGVIAYSLQVARHEHEPKYSFHSGRIFEHVR
jgi:hypothetical protein